VNKRGNFTSGDMLEIIKIIVIAIIGLIVIGALLGILFQG